MFTKFAFRCTCVFLVIVSASAAGEPVADLGNALVDPEFFHDKDSHERVLESAAEGYYRQKDYHRAEVRFSSLLNVFPDSLRTINWRFKLGECYWFIAGAEASKCKMAHRIVDDPDISDDRKREAKMEFEKSYEQYLEMVNKAAEPFKIVEVDLLKGMAKSRLTPGEAELLRKASLWAADCAFYSEKYDECQARYTAIAGRYAGTCVELHALRSKFICYKYYQEGQADKAADTFTQLQNAFLSMPDSGFDGLSESHRRDYWQKWLDDDALKK
jgi:hypothetical protein